jgi:hypothetical protein
MTEQRNSSRSRWLSICLGAALAVWTGVGCWGDSGGEESGSGASSAKETKKLRAKISRYSQPCLNQYSNRVLESRDRYLSWIDDPEAGPTGDEETVYGPLKISDPGRCKEAVKKAAEMEPDRPELEKSAKKFAEAVETLASKTEEAAVYYERENYKDDDFEKGKEMHDGLMEAFSKFEKANSVLSDRVDVIEDNLDSQLLERLEGNPERRTEYLGEKVRIIAKSLAGLIGNLEVEDRALVGDGETIVEKTEKLETTLDKLREELDSSDEDPEDFGSTVDEAEEALQAAKEVMRRVRDEKKFDQNALQDLNSGLPPDGSPKKYLDAYNDLISAYNARM